MEANADEANAPVGVECMDRGVSSTQGDRVALGW